MIILPFSTGRSLVAVVVDAYRDRMGAAELADLAAMLHITLPTAGRNTVDAVDIELAKALPTINDAMRQYLGQPNLFP